MDSRDELRGEAPALPGRDGSVGTGLVGRAAARRSFADASAAARVAAPPAHHPAVVVGAGPVGLATAIDLARQGTPVVLIDDDEKVSEGSRAICFAKRTLEIFDRLGCGDAVADKGVSWNTGKVFLRDELVYSFDLLPESGHRRPAFVNLQQYYVEAFLHDHAATLPNLDLRWRSKVVALAQDADGVRLTVDTPDGRYDLTGDYVVAADGSRSALRGMLGQTSSGRTFRDRFLIADIRLADARMEAEFPSERWFWFDPPFHPGQSVLLHRQPDNIFRIDFQLGWEADPVEERKPERVVPRVRALLGPDMPFELEWVSIYTFSCLRMESFRHGRVLFAGDSAHGVSPFGARGANSGVQDADNLAWKLRLVLQGLAPDRLLDTYAREREFAADENILNSTRSTDFITPKNAASRLFRDAVLQLSKDCGFARRLVNSGRLSIPATLTGSPLNTPDAEVFAGAMVPGAPCADAPVRRAGEDSWLLRELGDDFTLLIFADAALTDVVRSGLGELAADPVPVRPLVVAAQNAAEPDLRSVTDGGLAAARYDARSGTVYLIRPDQHVCARWRTFDLAKVRAAVARATCRA